MLIRVPREPRPGDARLALAPRRVATCTAAGHPLLFAARAGTAAAPR